MINELLGEGSLREKGGAKFVQRRIEHNPRFIEEGGKAVSESRTRVANAVNFLLSLGLRNLQPLIFWDFGDKTKFHMGFTPHHARGCRTSQPRHLAGGPCLIYVSSRKRVYNALHTHTLYISALCMHPLSCAVMRFAALPVVHAYSPVSFGHAGTLFANWIVL